MQSVFTMKMFLAENKKEWRDWLRSNCENDKEIWLVFHKKNSGKKSIDYETAVEEAICFGWVDSIIRKVDEEKYVRKFTPRKKNSKWSELNKKRAEKLIAEKRMTEIGLEKIEYAKKRGQWRQSAKPDISQEISNDFSEALKRNAEANKTFEKLALSHKKQYLLWINSAKRPDTKKRRIAQAIELLKKNEKLGMK